jgi:hypothetical protein
VTVQPLLGDLAQDGVACADLRCPGLLEVGGLPHRVVPEDIASEQAADWAGLPGNTSGVVGNVCDFSKTIYHAI